MQFQSNLYFSKSIERDGLRMVLQLSLEICLKIPVNVTKQGLGFLLGITFSLIALDKKERRRSFWVGGKSNPSPPSSCMQDKLSRGLDRNKKIYRSHGVHRMIGWRLQVEDAEDRGECCSCRVWTNRRRKLSKRCRNENGNGTAGKDIFMNVMAREETKAVHAETVGPVS